MSQVFMCLGFSCAAEIYSNPLIIRLFVLNWVVWACKPSRSVGPMFTRVVLYILFSIKNIFYYWITCSPRFLIFCFMSLQRLPL